MQKINLKIFLKKRKQRISFFSVSPTFDWFFILTISILIFTFGALYIGRVYLKILDESLFIVPIDEKAQQDFDNKQKNIQNVVDEIKNKKQNVVVQEEVLEEVLLTNQE